MHGIVDRVSLPRVTVPLCHVQPSQNGRANHTKTTASDHSSFRHWQNRMAVNPYRPSPNVVPSTPPIVSNEYSYYPLANLVIWSSVLLAMICACYLGISLLQTIGFLSFASFTDPNAFVESDAEMSLIVFMGIVGIATLPLFLANGILVCKFMYRGNSNVRYFGATGVVNSPGWCVGYWFIPIVNLIWPYLAMKEIAQASLDPRGEAWKGRRLDSSYGLWWACYVTGSILTQLETRLGSRMDLGMGGIVLSWISSLIMCLAALLLVHIMRKITHNQARILEQTDAAHAEDAFVAPAESP